MDRTPERKTRTRSLEPSVVEEQKENQTQNVKLKKPPPITPRRFNRFFTPRPRNATATVKTSRAALKVLTSSSVNIRNVQSTQSSQSDAAPNPGTPRGKKRKLSFVTNDSTQSSPATRVSFLHSSQEIRSSPTIPERRSPSRQTYQDVGMYDEEEVETDIEMDEEEDDDHPVVPAPRVIPYRAKSISGGIMSTRLSGKRTQKEAFPSDLWQQQTAHFYSSPSDINNNFGRLPAALPFAVAACNTNPIIAIGDEDGTVRVMDSSASNPDGLTKTFFKMRPHDNALMDLEFTADDTLLATACGDQSCQIIDMHTQRSLYTLKGHRCSVKRVSFQPGSGNNILATCGRDGQLNFWDLRCDYSKLPASRLRYASTNPMNLGAATFFPKHFIRDAHTAGPRSAKTTNAKAKINLVPGRNDFSITSLSFLGAARPHLLVTASEIDTTVKVWDVRYHHSVNQRTPVPLSCTDEPVSHEFHRRFGVTSLVVNTDGSKLYALSRDHTVYAYSTAHLVMGSAPQISENSKPIKGTHNAHSGLGPLYGFRHPLLRVQTFWPRLAIRKQTDSTPELLAVGSTEDCAVLFPTDERFLNKSTMSLSSYNVGKASFTSSFSSQPPTLTRSASASSTSGLFNTENKEGISIYRHGTGLIRGHDKEVTSLAWTSEGSLVTASDDYTVRCWREDPENARRMRNPGERNGEKWKRGWSAVEMEGFDDEC